MNDSEFPTFNTNDNNKTNNLRIMVRLGSIITHNHLNHRQQIFMDILGPVVNALGSDDPVADYGILLSALIYNNDLFEDIVRMDLVRILDNAKNNIVNAYHKLLQDAQTLRNLEMKLLYQAILPPDKYKLNRRIFLCSSLTDLDTDLLNLLQTNEQGFCDEFGKYGVLDVLYAEMSGETTKSDIGSIEYALRVNDRSHHIESHLIEIDQEFIREIGELKLFIHLYGINNTIYRESLKLMIHSPLLYGFSINENHKNGFEGVELFQEQILRKSSRGS